MHNTSGRKLALAAAMPPRRVGAVFAMVAATLCLCSVATATTITEPDGSNDRVAAGMDFATAELNNQWDFDSESDIVAPESNDLLNEAFSNGIFSFDSAQAENRPPGVSDASFFVLFQGVFNSLGMSNGNQFPIDTSRYRYLSLRVRVTSSSGPPLGTTQQMQAFFFEDQDSFVANPMTFGFTQFQAIPANEWTTLIIDLWNSTHGGSNFAWTDFDFVRGLRIDPVGVTDIHVEIDWLRLTEASSAGERFTAQWTDDGSSSYIVSLVDQADNSIVYEIDDNVVGTSLEIDLSHYPSADYLVRVEGDFGAMTSTDPIEVNDFPQFQFTTPSIGGDQSLAYGAAENGNPWGPLDPGDVDTTDNWEFVAWDQPVGSFYGRPSSNDPQLLWETPSGIDTDLYRALCWQLEIFGERDIGTGSVARILYGNILSQLATSKPIVVEAGTNEYCIRDLRNDLTLESTSGQPGAPTAWEGVFNHIRLDPHEFPPQGGCGSAAACRDVRVDSFYLAPFHRADPDFTLQWTDSDSDDNAAITLYVDPDEDHDSGNEIEIGTVNENAANSFLWNAAAQVADGEYFVFADIDDGLNSTRRKAGSLIVAGPPPTLLVTVQEPNGVGDVVQPATEFGQDDRADAFDMSQSTDLVEARNVSGLSFIDGIASGEATGAPLLVMITPDSGDPAIDTTFYRYVTIKLRMTNGGGGNHFARIAYSTQSNFAGNVRGLTFGQLVPEGEWTVLTFDLLTDEHPTSTISWSDFTEMPAIRVEPTQLVGSTFELDWVTITGAPTGQTTFDIQWSANSDLGLSTQHVFLVDQRGDLIPVAEDLDAAVRNALIDLTVFPEGSYDVLVDVDPGPDAMSSGPLTIIAEDLILSTSFE